MQDRFAPGESDYAAQLLKRASHLMRRDDLLGAARALRLVALASPDELEIAAFHEMAAAIRRRLAEMEGAHRRPACRILPFVAPRLLAPGSPGMSRSPSDSSRSTASL